jgi:penicillin-binding protein 2
MVSGLSSIRKRTVAPGRGAIGNSLMHSPASREILFRRAVFLMLLVTVVTGGFVYRLVQLQLTQGTRYRQMAEENRIRLIPIASDRGVITDRSGHLLAADRLSRSVYLWPRQQTPKKWQETALRLSPLLKVPAQEIVARLEQAGYNSPLPVRIGQQLNREAYVALAEQAQQFSGVEMVAESSRYYPNNELAAHVLGYIGEATEADVKAHPEYPNGIIVGQMGVERLVNQQLQGVWGSRMVEVDASGRELRALGTKPAISGSRIQLTIDINLQKAAERALSQRRGAAVVLDVKTGEVLALASGPSFDPNLFTRRVTEAEWQNLQSRSEPFLNRALQGYPPGSTFKIVTAAAGLQSGKFSPDSMLNTAACINVGGTNFCEHGDQGYGAIGFQEALTVSSNTFFYQVGMSTGPEQIEKWGRALGIGNSSDLGLGGAGRSFIPTPALKEQQYREPWYAGDTVTMTIGQGLVLATPLDLAVMVSAIANGGLRVQPHLLMNQTATPAMAPKKTGLDQSTIDTIRAGLIAVVQRGTAQSLNDGKIPLTAGKTGTAEVVGESNSMFVGYGPANNPQIAVAVVVENGGYGAVAAVPIAHEIYKSYFSRRPVR